MSIPEHKWNGISFDDDWLNDAANAMSLKYDKEMSIEQMRKSGLGESVRVMSILSCLEGCSFYDCWNEVVRRFYDIKTSYGKRISHGKK